MAKLLLVYTVDDKVKVEDCLIDAHVKQVGGLAFNARWALEERKGKDQLATVVKVEGDSLYRTPKLLSSLAEGKL